MPINLILKKPTTNLPNNIIPMLVKGINPDSNKYRKLIKFCRIQVLSNSMTQQELLDKDGPKWVVKLNKELIPINNIKMSSIVCHLNKDNNFKDKLRQD